MAEDIIQKSSEGLLSPEDIMIRKDKADEYLQRFHKADKAAVGAFLHRDESDSGKFYTTLYLIQTLTSLLKSFTEMVFLKPVLKLEILEK